AVVVGLQLHGAQRRPPRLWEHAHRVCPEAASGRSEGRDDPANHRGQPSPVSRVRAEEHVRFAMTHRRFVAAGFGFALAIALAAVPVRGAGWSPQLAAKYLDERQREWFAWPQAQSPNGPCVSCHTGMPYLVARPALRRLLKETQPTMYETGLLDRL